MSQKSIRIIGIMIAADYKDFKLYEMEESWDVNVQGGRKSNSKTEAKGLKDIARFLSVGQESINQYVIVYDVSCPNKEDHIKKLLIAINNIKKNDLLPTLISIGHEQSPLNENIREQFSDIKEVANTGSHEDLFKTIIGTEKNNIKKEMESSLKLERKTKEFTAQLGIISKKAVILRNNGHLTAADKADELHTNLSQHSQTYFDNPTPESYITFKQQAKHDIQTAYDELSKHRGWKRVLGNIGFAILGLGILYLAAVLINRNVFFNKSDSAEKLDNLKSLVDNNAFQI